MAFFARKTLFLLTTLILATMLCKTSNGEVFDLDWWHAGAPILHYDTWGSENKFHVGDTIVLHYSPDYDGVAQVTRKNFETCNFANPIASWTDTWPAYIPITEPGRFYFISDEPGHCEVGQKFTIYVPKPYSEGPQLAPSPSTSNASPKGPSSAIGLASFYFIWICALVLA